MFGRRVPGDAMHSEGVAQAEIDVVAGDLYLNAALWDREDTTYVDRAALVGGGFFKRMFGGDVSPQPFLEQPG